MLRRNAVPVPSPALGRWARVCHAPLVRNSDQGDTGAKSGCVKFATRELTPDIWHYRRGFGLHGSRNSFTRFCHRGMVAFPIIEAVANRVSGARLEPTKALACSDRPPAGGERRIFEWAVAQSFGVRSDFERRRSGRLSRRGFPPPALRDLSRYATPSP